MPPALLPMCQKMPHALPLLGYFHDLADKNRRLTFHFQLLTVRKMPVPMQKSKFLDLLMPPDQYEKYNGNPLPPPVEMRYKCQVQQTKRRKSAS